ncbi:MAG: hypothetical protein ACYDCC_09795 [Actinomycetota bacterium]
MRNVLAGAILFTLLTPNAQAPVSSQALSVTIVADTLHPGASFDPQLALGGTLDGHYEGSTSSIYTQSNERAMLGSGLGAVSLRLRTELAVDAWHWNPKGSWSDPIHHRGYWTSSDDARDVIRTSYGYSLAHRGASGDQANESSYSRIDDGSSKTCWKSNPYLDPHFTREPESAHPQWVMLDLGRLRPIDQLRITWCTPYATRFHLERWTGYDPTYPLGAYVDPGVWTAFPSKEITGRAGTQSVSLSQKPVYAEWVRVVLDRSSHPSGTQDIRTRLGFAIAELRIGLRTKKGFRDWVTHSPSQRQTTIYTSSTDPWHDSSALDPGVEEPGFDTVLQSGLTRNLPILIPVSVLYGTPDDAASELRWLEARHVKIRGLELGEEPDGQLAAPADYAALYAQFARALRRVDPHVPLGGPSFQTSTPDWHFWPDKSGTRSWLKQFLTELTAQGELNDLNFFSFEWYPFPETACGPPAPLIQKQAALLRWLLHQQHVNGLPQNIPIYISELGFSPYATPTEVELPGAFFDADAIATALDQGVSVFFYGYEPDGLYSTPGLQCSSDGTLALFLSNSNGGVAQPLATYWAINMMTNDWMEPRATPLAMLPVSISSGGDNLRAYALKRSDGKTAFLVINEDPRTAMRLNVRETSATGTQDFALSNEVLLSSENYVWHEAGDHGSASPDNAPVHQQLHSSSVELPAWSMAILN